MKKIKEEINKLNKAMELCAEEITNVFRELEKAVRQLNIFESTCCRIIES